MNLHVRVEGFREVGLTVTVNSATTDLGIPVVITLCLDDTGAGPASVIAARADFDIESAIARSLEETAQTRLWARKLMRDCPEFEPATDYSLRQYTGESLTVDEVGRLLFFTGGITGSLPLDNGTLLLRSSPSASALYPIEIYLVAFAVDSLPQGVYHYEVEGNALEFVRAGSFLEEVFEITHRQEMVLKASLCLLMTAVFRRTKHKYGERGYRYVLLDAGHVAQSLYLESTALGLGCATIGGFLDDRANRLVGVDGLEESVVYMATVGRAVQSPVI